MKLIRTFLDVYVFTDEYDISQLRRDVMTAILHYCTMFQWHPELTKEIHAAAFESHPSNSQLCHYLINATAVTWNPKKDAKRVELIKIFQRIYIWSDVASVAESLWLPGMGWHERRAGQPLSLPQSQWLWRRERMPRTHYQPGLHPSWINPNMQS